MKSTLAHGLRNIKMEHLSDSKRTYLVVVCLTGIEMVPVGDGVLFRMIRLPFSQKL